MSRNWETNIRTYLHRYHQDEAKFFTWLKSNYVDPKEAVETINSYMVRGKSFKDTHEFCESVVRDTRQREVDELLSPFDVNLKLPRRTILWHLITNLLVRLVGIPKRLLKKL